jgi:hypothetical protein
MLSHDVELYRSDYRVADRREHYQRAENYTGLVMSTAGSESLSPSALQCLLALAFGVILITAGAIFAVMILIFHTVVSEMGCSPRSCWYWKSRKRSLRRLLQSIHKLTLAPQTGSSVPQSSRTSVHNRATLP